MSIEIHGDERDWEPGGIYYDGPSEVLRKIAAAST